jgi:hypothetical protein
MGLELLLQDPFPENCHHLPCCWIPTHQRCSFDSTRVLPSANNLLPRGIFQSQSVVWQASQLPG